MGCEDFTNHHHGQSWNSQPARDLARAGETVSYGRSSATIYSLKLSNLSDQGKAAQTALWMFGKNVSNVVLGSPPEHLTKSLGTV